MKNFVTQSLTPNSKPALMSHATQRAIPTPQVNRENNMYQGVVSPDADNQAQHKGGIKIKWRVGSGETV